MFRSYYGFKTNPFDKQLLSEKDAFQSHDYIEMTSRLNFLQTVRGIGVFTSPPGFGKTYALRCFARSLDKNLNEIAYISLSTVSLTEFYNQLCLALGIDTSRSKPVMFKSIQDRLYYLYKERKKPLFLIVDEAHELSAAILKELKMIMNCEYDSLNCFSLVLVGEPHLNRTLEKSIHEALRQRIVIHYGFSGLSDSETKDYILHKLSVASAPASVLGEGTLPAITGYAQSCPRLIDNLLNEAFTLGAQANLLSLTTDIIMAAANNLSLS